MPADGFLLQQEQAAQQIRQVDPLPASSRQYAAVDGGFHDLLNAVPGMQGRFKGIKRRRLADPVHAHAQRVHIGTERRMAGKDHVQSIHEARNRGRNLVRWQPAGHLYREGDQQHHVANHRRVKRVMAQSTIQLFGNDHRKHGAEDHHPPWSKRRDTDRQQQPGQQRGVIGQNAGDSRLAQLKDKGFRR